MEQTLNKIKNNIIGLGYNFEYEWLKNYIKENPKCIGNENIKNQINIFENTFKIHDANIFYSIPITVELDIFIYYIKNNLPK